MTTRRAAPGAGAPSTEVAGLDHLGTLLVETGAISEDQARIALTEQSSTGTRFADILTRLGFVTEAIIRDAVGGALGIESVDLGRTVAEPDATAAIPEPVARRFLAVGLTLERDADGAPRRLTVAMADPFDVIALDHLRSLFDDEVEIVPFLAGRADIERFLERACRHDLSVSGILREIETGESDPSGLPATADEYSQPIVRLVDVLLSDAVKRGASDIHFEPEAGFLRVRYRIDGVLRQVRSLHRSYWSAIAVRLKVICGMNIAETRAPQDGRMTLSVSGHDIDYRVSSLPTAHGENIVLRVLDRSRGIVALDELGMSPDALAELRRMMERPEGVILVTGPTGSGKTTTLYSILAHLDREAVNIMTLEDPVEYPMSRIRQTSINEAVKLDFANGVRSLMRQDPDIILVGEIRDADTAAMTFRAAMTGHQVYSRLPFTRCRHGSGRESIRSSRFPAALVVKPDQPACSWRASISIRPTKTSSPIRTRSSAVRGGSPGRSGIRTARVWASSTSAMARSATRARCTCSSLRCGRTGLAASSLSIAPYEASTQPNACSSSFSLSSFATAIASSSSSAS